MYVYVVDSYGYILGKLLLFMNGLCIIYEEEFKEVIFMYRIVVSFCFVW